MSVIGLGSHDWRICFVQVFIFWLFLVDAFLRLIVIKVLISVTGRSSRQQWEVFVESQRCPSNINVACLPIVKGRSK